MADEAERRAIIPHGRDHCLTSNSCFRSASVDLACKLKRLSNLVLVCARVHRPAPQQGHNSVCVEKFLCPFANDRQLVGDVRALLDTRSHPLVKKGVQSGRNLCQTTFP